MSARSKNRYGAIGYPCLHPLSMGMVQKKYHIKIEVTLFKMKLV